MTIVTTGNASRHYKKQFRRDTGSAKGYKTSIVEDAFSFAGQDISESRQKQYEDFLNV